MKKYLKNERGSVPMPLTPFIVVAIVILLSFLMTWISAEITFTGIRNTVKNELTNVSIRISEDTYKAMREGNLAAYHETLTSDDTYRSELEALVKEKIETAMPLTTDNYVVDNISLTFSENSDSIEYVFHCDVEYYLSLFGDHRTVREDSIELTGKHNIKAY